MADGQELLALQLERLNQDRSTAKGLRQGAIAQGQLPQVGQANVLSGLAQALAGKFVQGRADTRLDELERQAGTRQTQKEQGVTNVADIIGRGGDRNELVQALVGSRNPELIKQGVASALKPQKGAVDAGGLLKDFTPESVQNFFKAGGTDVSVLQRKGGDAKRNIQADAKGRKRFVDSGALVFPDVEGGKEEKREIKADAFGRQRFIDSGELVFPEVTESPKQIKVTADKKKATARANQQIEQAGAVVDRVGDALGKVGFLTTGGTGKAASIVPGTEAFDLDSDITTIKANLGFDRLQKMRENSPTGGALGQVAVQELEALQASVANLDLGQSEDQLTTNLQQVKNHYERWRNTVLESQGQEPIPITDFNAAAAAPVQVAVGRFQVEEVD